MERSEVRAASVPVPLTSPAGDALDRACRPIIALALRIGGAVEYFALAASCRLRSSSEKAASATGLPRIQRLLGVVVQFALPVLGLAKVVGIDADELLLIFSMTNGDPANRTGEDASRQLPQSGTTSLHSDRLGRPSSGLAELRSIRTI